MLGGKDNFPADRKMAEEIFALLPEVGSSVRENRGFLQRATRFLAREAGIRQFVDIGTGIPTQGNVHEVVAPIAPDARVVYVDNVASAASPDRPGGYASCWCTRSGRNTDMTSRTETTPTGRFSSTTTR
jgi:hypothetical protein